MTDDTEHEGMDRLEAALDAWLEFRDSGRSEAELLAAYPELRDLLEPMLEGGDTDSDPGPGSTPTSEPVEVTVCDDRSGTCELATEEISAVLELLPNFKVKAEAKARR